MDIFNILKLFLNNSSSVKKKAIESPTIDKIVWVVFIILLVSGFFYLF